MLKWKMLKKKTFPRKFQEFCLISQFPRMLFQDYTELSRTSGHLVLPVVCGETVYKSQFLIVNKKILKISNNKTLENSELENGLKKIY